jgi:hypothetical protein
VPERNDFRVNDVESASKSGVIQIVPAREIHGPYQLEELVARIPKGYHKHEIDWGSPVGK